MYHRVKRKTATDVAVGWDAVIADAKERIRKLEISVKVFTERKEMGQACPFTQQRAQSHDQSSEPCHSD